MSLTTKNEIVQEIAYELYSGMPSNDRSVSDQFILRKLNDKIAYLATKSAFGTYNLDGVVAADDIFRITYSNLALSTDTVTGVKYVALPSQPVGLPSNRAFEVYPPAMRGGVQSSIFKMIRRDEATFIRSLPGIRKVFCYVDGGNMNFIDAFDITATYTTVNMSVVTSGANDLSAYLNLPDDMITECKALVLADLRPMVSLQDTTPLPVADNPQPR